MRNLGFLNIAYSTYNLGILGNPRSSSMDYTDFYIYHKYI